MCRGCEGAVGRAGTRVPVRGLRPAASGRRTPARIVARGSSSSRGFEVVVGHSRLPGQGGWCCRGQPPRTGGGPRCLGHGRRHVDRPGGDPAPAGAKGGDRSRGRCSDTAGLVSTTGTSSSARRSAGRCAIWRAASPTRSGGGWTLIPSCRGCHSAKRRSIVDAGCLRAGREPRPPDAPSVPQVAFAHDTPPVPLLTLGRNPTGIRARRARRDG